jgi:uncharacterized protein (DUF1800 family)
MGQPLDPPAALAHLLRRAAISAGSGTAGVEGASSYEQAVERVLATLDEGPPALPEGFDAYRPGAIQHAWLARLLAGGGALAERLAFFWHGHFATSQAKVTDGPLLWRQMELFRAQGAGRFEDLVLAVSRDVAMVRFLDGNANRKGHPNENYARELMELFTLGRGAYGEHDVRELARAFSGWGSRHHEFAFTEAFHDGGAKELLGHAGTFGGEEAVKIVVAHPACAPFVCRKLARFFLTPQPPEPLIERLVAAWKASDGRLRDVLRALFLDPEFRDAAHERALVRSPVEFVVAGARLAGLSELPTAVEGSLDRLGQVLFRPPSVKGWTSGTAWLTAGTLVERLRAAQLLAAGVSAEASEAAIVREFGPTPPAALRAVLSAAPPERRLALAFASPEFQLA